MISFEHVSKFILKDINLHIPEGVIAGIAGVSGSGKTTLLRLACGLLQCEQGNVWTFGKNPVEKRKQIAPYIRVFFSGIPMFPRDSTILYEYQKLCNVYRIGKQDFQREYEMLAEQLQFGAYEEIPIRQLSLGQRRRAELAVMLLGEARLILLDEPVIGLDEQGKGIFRELLKEKRKTGAAIVMVSQNMVEEEMLCDRIVLLDDGQLLYYGERDRLMKKYAPCHEMEIVFQGKLPDMEDLPLIKYRMENNSMILRYNSNIISAAEILNQIMVQTVVTQMNIRSPRLQDVIIERKKDLKK